MEKTKVESRLALSSNIHQGKSLKSKSLKSKSLKSKNRDGKNLKGKNHEGKAFEGKYLFNSFRRFSLEAIEAGGPRALEWSSARALAYEDGDVFQLIFDSGDTYKCLVDFL